MNAGKLRVTIKNATVQRTKPITTRQMKKADWEEDCFCIYWGD